MRSEDLDRALGPTPQGFADRMDKTLRSLKEEKEMKKTAFRTGLVFAMVAVLLGTTAFALVSQGLEWYYSNRFTAYQEHEPEKYNAIMSHMNAQVNQVMADDPEMEIAVTETSWAAEEGVLVVSVLASARSPEKTELHPMWNLDADGVYVSKDAVIDPEDEEARTEHWLWTQDGFGPVEKMVAPGKQLLLLACEKILLNGERLLGDGSSVDAYVTDSGAVHTVIELRLDENCVAELMAADADGDGVVRLSAAYTVTAYTEDDQQLYTGGRDGEINFELKIR